MSQTYTIREVSTRTRDWETKDGKSKNRSFYVKVEGDDKVYEVARKFKDGQVQAPQVGESFEAEVETREHEGTTYYKLKRVYQQRGGPGGNRNSPEDFRLRAAQGALSNAIALCPDGTPIPTITQTADQFYDWLIGKKEGQ